MGKRERKRKAILFKKVVTFKTRETQSMVLKFREWEKEARGQSREDVVRQTHHISDT